LTTSGQTLSLSYQYVSFKGLPSSTHNAWHWGCKGASCKQHENVGELHNEFVLTDNDNNWSDRNGDLYGQSRYFQGTQTTKSFKKLALHAYILTYNKRTQRPLRYCDISVRVLFVREKMPRTVRSGALVTPNSDESRHKMRVL
jgi:hypothetical protein